MDVSANPVTYCTNIHPGETWAETLENIVRHGLEVKQALCPDAPFPLGLRISGLASLELDRERALGFRDFLAESGLYVRTVNGFPYGRFHGAPVKARVYRPDWRDPERLAYTVRLADLLDVWLPEGLTGSISSVPLGFRADFAGDDAVLARARLRRALEHLDELAQAGGRLIRLSLEPEPGCLLETTADVIRFFEEFAAEPGICAYLPYLAVCYDCCHQALQFEDPAASLRALAERGIPIGHVQVSSALRLESPDLTRLAGYDEPVYLHQAVGRLAGGGLLRHDDLPAALAGGDAGALAWRVHFHLPVFLEELPECLSTQPFLREILPLFAPDVPLEVETYTWSVLPEALRLGSLTDFIVREIEWVEGRRAARLSP